MLHLKELKKLEGEKILWTIVLITHNLISKTLWALQCKRFKVDPRKPSGDEPPDGTIGSFSYSIMGLSL